MNVCITTKRSVIFDNAAEKGRIDIIEWLLVNRSQDREGSNMYYAAIKGGHLHVVQYLLDRDNPISLAICDHSKIRELTNILLTCLNINLFKTQLLNICMNLSFSILLFFFNTEE
ncbi:hypothetical protein PPL_07467 [Heterostelium album PN500]|uniref:Ankyrin repeat protein n=1 Tax=Heterostelium pallidum (strain ATCC 26659 / Pp 5 / PN500) TaxID=670386 RepID=D3BG16_HETP5|nr:hypothetical protein PPL_07467 [Heterostelium album PN500]EFA79608.1 hypothetical protein PPL_07467 [Heterostelium album PN500]|eukprot:XP_020431729.1 hypothetical protein PPL_07467 [Heterostelium album PN500]